MYNAYALLKFFIHYKRQNKMLNKVKRGRGYWPRCYKQRVPLGTKTEIAVPDKDVFFRVCRKSNIK